MKAATDYDREALYREVWSTPMTALAKKYGLSDQGLRKVCVRLQIPLPRAGHWARVAVGRPPPQPALPPYSEAKATAGAAVRSRERAKAQEAARTAWVPPIPPAADEAPTRWHPVLKQLRQRAKEGAKRAVALKRIHDWEQKHPGRQYPYREGFNFYGSWSHFAEKGQLAIETHKRCALRVSVEHADRALSVLNVVANLAAGKGLAVQMENDERLELRRGDTSIEVRLAERFDSEKRKEMRSWSKTWELVKVAVPTGRLSLYVEGPSSAQTVLTDKADDLLETRHAEIWAAIEQRLQVTAEKDRERAEWHRQYEEEQRKRQEQARREQERQRAEAEEKRRREVLFDEAAAWQRTNSLRAYLAELDQRVAVGGREADGFSAWRAWAGEVLAQAELAQRVQTEPSTKI